MHEDSGEPEDCDGAEAHLDEEVCLCFHVSLRKIRNFVRRTDPKVPSQIADCLGAGTGCRWCVPFLERLHRQWQEGKELQLPVAPSEYAARRRRYRRTGERGESDSPVERSDRTESS